MKSSTKTPEQIINDVLQSEQYGRIVIEHPEIDSLIKEWQEKIGMKARQSKTKNDALQFIEMKIKDGSVRNINQETEINNRDLPSGER